MLEPITLKILFALYGFAAGSVVPFCLAYAFGFVKKSGLALKTLLALALRFLWLFFLILFLMSGFTWTLVVLAGGPWTGEVEELAKFLGERGFGMPMGLGMAVGFWGGLLVFIIGFVKTIRRHTK